MSHQKRIGAGLLCVIFALALLVSSAFVIHEAGHICTGEDCLICQAIAMNGHLLRLFGAAVLVLAFLLGILRTKHAWADTPELSAPVFGTLVSWKIRLNN